MDNCNISAVICFLNESDCIVEFCKHMDTVAASLPCEMELVFVDDGSSDDTVDKIRGYHFRECRRVKIISLSKNYGSHSAIRAGILNSSFEICIFLAVDMQEPDDMIPKAYQKMSGGYDAVYIEKKSIDIKAKERLFSKVYSWLMRKYAVKNYGRGGINNIMFNGKIKDYLNSHMEGNSSISLQIIDAGFKYTILEMVYKKREKGESKWTLSKKIKLFIDSFVAFSFLPIRLVSVVGIIMFILGGIFGITVIAAKIIHPDIPVGYSTLASLMALGFGVTNISLGIIAEYLWRTYDASRNRPVFLVRNQEVVFEKDMEK